jgi:hypothetical protein
MNWKCRCKDEALRAEDGECIEELDDYGCPYGKYDEIDNPGTCDGDCPAYCPVCEEIFDLYD